MEGMFIMKNRFAFLSVLFCCAVLFLSGCGKKDNGKIRIGVSIPGAVRGWNGGVVWWAEQTKKELERKDPQIEVILSTAEAPSEQAGKIEKLMVQGINALVVLPQEPASLTGICSQARERGIYLVAVDRNLKKNIQDLTVAGDNAEFGRRCAEEMAKRLKGKGDILIMEGVPGEVNSLRVNAFRNVMKKYPGIRILESRTSDWSQETGLKLMTDFLRKYKKIDAVWAGDDGVLTGALKAYAGSKRNDIKFFIGGGGAKAIVKRVLDKDPLVPFNVTYSPRMIAYGIEFAAAAAKGKPTAKSKVEVIPAEVITPANAKYFYQPNSPY